jgi:hypothetical protein
MRNCSRQCSWAATHVATASPWDLNSDALCAILLCEIENLPNLVGIESADGASATNQTEENMLRISERIVEGQDVLCVKLENPW